jgi:hypothetical protein
LESSEVLRVTVKVGVGFSVKSESFYARMGRDGRITVPWLALVLLQNQASAGKSLVGHVLEVKIEPAERLRRCAAEP